MNLGFIPPLGRVRTWKTDGIPGGPSNTYVVIQVPRNPGTIASKRIEEAVKQTVEATKKEGRSGLYVVLTDFVKLFRG